MSSDPWDELDREIERWRDDGREVTLWWRDDDATRPGPALDRLLDLNARWQAPLALAVVPATMAGSLVPRLEAASPLQVLQHGYAHVDHAGPDEPGSELGEHRPRAQALAELAEGFARLQASLPARFEPVLVPPFNRISQSLIPFLAELGFRGLSCFAPRARRVTPQGVVCCNCHVDPISWKRGGEFRGDRRCLRDLVDHLAARRAGAADADEPTGLLTHHLRHDDALWTFLDRLFRRLAPMEGVRWLDARTVFAP